MPDRTRPAPSPRSREEILKAQAIKTKSDTFVAGVEHDEHDTIVTIMMQTDRARQQQATFDVFGKFVKRPSGNLVEVPAAAPAHDEDWVARAKFIVQRFMKWSPSFRKWSRSSTSTDLRISPNV